MNTIFRRYDAGFKHHTQEEQAKQKDAIRHVFNSAANYLLENGNEQQKLIAKQYLEES